jgi:hypothetical protein
VSSWGAATQCGKNCADHKQNGEDKNEILAISTAALAMPPKPRTPAISANIKKLMDQASIAVSLACDAFV